MNASGAMKGALIYRTDSDQFSLRTDNTTAFSIDSSQLVSFNGDIELNGSGTRQIRFDDGTDHETEDYTCPDDDTDDNIDAGTNGDTDDDADDVGRGTR